MIAAWDSTVSPTYIIDLLNDTLPPSVVQEDSRPPNTYADRTTSRSYFVGSFPLSIPVLTMGTALSPSSSTVADEGTLSSRPFGWSDWATVASSTLIDPWLERAFESISAYRDRDYWADHYDVAPSYEALDVAEQLAVKFTSAPVHRRPQFIIDSEGQPSFTSYNDDLYLHLTIAADGLVSWYRTAQGDEDFGDDVDVGALPTEVVNERVLALNS